MEVKQVVTDDGSSTLFSAQFSTHYHSTRGAIGEANHVFIRFLEACDSVLEVGFGTGLNTLLSLQSGLKIDYTTIELFPLDMSVVRKLSFYCPELEVIHAAPWGVRTKIGENFSLLKLHTNITTYTPTQIFTKIFYDPFDPTIVPDQWSAEIFATLRPHLQGQLLTYCAKGIVKQALREAGFTITRLQGALGKHHMLACH